MVLLKPVDDIMEKLGITPHTLGLSDDHDEFFRLNSALDSLTAQVSEVHSVLHERNSSSGSVCCLVSSMPLSMSLPCLRNIRNTVWSFRIASFP